MITPIADGTVPWPEDLAREYTQAGWWRGQALGAEIAAVADARQAATALIDGAARISYASLAARADALASRLTDGLGLERGDRIVVQLPNCWPFVVLTLGCLRAGIVPVMALPAHREHELAYLCEHSEARALAVPDVLRGFDHQHMAERLRVGSATLRHILVAGQDVHEGNEDLAALCAEPDPGPAQAADSAGRARWDADQPDARDVAVFLLSGGTTGLPKLIARTHNDYSYNARASAALCGLGEGTVYLATLPASHNFPLACPGILGALLSGGRVVMLASPQPQTVFATIEQEGVTITAVVPAVAQRWLAHAEEHGARQLRTARPAGRRRPARRRTGPAGPAGPRRDAPAGLRHGRRAAELHPAGRYRRGNLRYARPAAEPGRRGAHRGRRRERQPFPHPSRVAINKPEPVPTRDLQPAYSIATRDGSECSVRRHRFAPGRRNRRR